MIPGAAAVPAPLRQDVLRACNRASAHTRSANVLGLREARVTLEEQFEPLYVGTQSLRSSERLIDDAVEVTVRHHSRRDRCQSTELLSQSHCPSEVN
jgi:hypothetical protein